MTDQKFVWMLPDASVECVVTPIFGSYEACREACIEGNLDPAYIQKSPLIGASADENPQPPRSSQMSRKDMTLKEAIGHMALAMGHAERKDPEKVTIEDLLRVCDYAVYCIAHAHDHGWPEPENTEDTDAH